MGKLCVKWLKLCNVRLVMPVCVKNCFESDQKTVKWKAKVEIIIDNLLFWGVLLRKCQNKCLCEIEMKIRNYNSFKIKCLSETLETFRLCLATSFSYQKKKNVLNVESTTRFLMSLYLLNQYVNRRWLGKFEFKRFIGCSAKSNLPTIYVHWKSWKLKVYVFVKKFIFTKE